MARVGKALRASRVTRPRALAPPRKRSIHTLSVSPPSDTSSMLGKLDTRQPHQVLLLAQVITARTSPLQSTVQ
ncbi:hypothetical protein CBOM_07944 [Ceraceosorus bombacis]|uniref:Uncharacterized protein n=1 Tax=Ceraceosorus bombacis TaxID=401625 RepID=A0A0N7LBC2_9BASI|nr:hypothetical protein CBOM_07944 [Ceraceosorus bombacis]